MLSAAAAASARRGNGSGGQNYPRAACSLCMELDGRHGSDLKAASRCVRCTKRHAGDAAALTDHFSLSAAGCTAIRACNSPPIGNEQSGRVIGRAGRRSVAQGARAHVVTQPAARCGETHLRMRRGAAETRCHGSSRVTLSFSIIRNSCRMSIKHTWHVWSLGEENVRSFLHRRRAVRSGRLREILLGENAITDNPSLQNSAIVS